MQNFFDKNSIKFVYFKHHLGISYCNLPVDIHRSEWKRNPFNQKISVIVFVFEVPQEKSPESNEKQFRQRPSGNLFSHGNPRTESELFNLVQANSPSMFFGPIT